MTENSFRPLLSIVGPTAVGKSDVALAVAQLLLEHGWFTSVELISADSRQVYQGLEIISGADVPAEFESTVLQHFVRPVFKHHVLPIMIHGIGILEPDKPWSVFDFRIMAQEIMTQAWQRGSLPIIVGGTGLYQQALNYEAMPQRVAPNPEIRDRAEGMTVAELQNWLRDVDVTALAAMNQSDVANPRRLVRAIENASRLETELAESHPAAVADFEPPTTSLTIGINDDISAIENRIAARVQQRFEQGALREVDHLVASFQTSQALKAWPIFSTTGVKPLQALLTGQTDQATALQAWVVQERQYAKRQLTWWRKQSDVVWIERSEPDWQEAARKLVAHWLKPDSSTIY